MQVYRIICVAPGVDQDPEYEGTCKDAHNRAKDRFLGMSQYARIELIDVDTTKDGILGLLSGRLEPKVISTWGLTRRGGLMEIPNGE